MSTQDKKTGQGQLNQYGQQNQADKKRKAFDQGKPHHDTGQDNKNTKTSQPDANTNQGGHHHTGQDKSYKENKTSQSGIGEHTPGAGANHAGYKEKNPQRKPKPGEKDHPKVTNQDNKITNTEDNEEPVEERSPTDLIDNKDPEIDTPIHDPEKKEKKIPKMKNGVNKEE